MSSLAKLNPVADHARTNGDSTPIKRFNEHSFISNRYKPQAKQKQQKDKYLHREYQNWNKYVPYEKRQHS
jgi:hypothetical protein